MTNRVLLDTGPLVAFLDKRQRFSEWADSQLHEFACPVLTCEAVLTEACFLLWRDGQSPDPVMRLLAEGRIATPFRLQEEAHAVRELVRRYANVPMSLADACLVRMSEQHPGCTVLTLDSHFRIYRRHGRKVIPTLMPEDL